MTPILGGLLAFVLLAAIAFAAMILWARSHPLEAFVAMTRRQLRKQGMERREAGGIVYFAPSRKLESLRHVEHRSETWRELSSSRALVLIHGVNDQAGTWATVIPKLARSYRIIAIDLPGHGESAPKTGPLPMQSMIDAVSAVVDKESPNAPVLLAGNSMGGWVATLYAAEHPERVSQLILEDASGMAWDISHVPAFPKTREESLKLLRMVHGPSAPLPDTMVDAMITLAPNLPQKRVLEAGILPWLTDARLPLLNMPVTLIWGADDGLLPVAYAEAMKTKLSNATLHVIDGAAHIPHRQNPERFLACLPATS